MEGEGTKKKGDSRVFAPNGDEGGLRVPKGKGSWVGGGESIGGILPSGKGVSKNPSPKKVMKKWERRIGVKMG